MKKVLASLLPLIALVAHVYSGPLTLSGTQPAVITYQTNTQITSGNGTVTIDNGTANQFFDIASLNSGGTASDRSTWTISGGSATISVPFIIKNPATGLEILDKKYDGGCGPSNVFTLTNTTSQTENYNVVISSNVNAYLPGTYTKTITLIYYKSLFADWTSKVPSNTKAITLSLYVPSITTISLSTPTINFLPFATGEQAPISLYVTANRGYYVTVQSTNGFRMKLAGAAEYIDYTLTMGGFSITKASANPFTLLNVSSLPAPVSAEANPGTFSIGPITSLNTAGDYADTLTFTITGQ